VPDPRLVIVTGRTVTVRMGIDTQTITRQFEHIPIELIGTRTDVNYRITPNEVTVLVTGPQPLLNQLGENDLSVLVDVSSLNRGDSAQIAPIAAILNRSTAVTTTVLPALIDVEAFSSATAEAAPG